ncbi:FAD/NAD(P)-binding protein [Robiginitalea aurantiaca]|uniref:FAD/NAD(P)-binding protein n=1 Tax=Robiginitalea aurantiaca TaxID=3056915 RepID=A0ABT7WI26_9FLAO|nr:FAD/NAD(P)-binding protein [Robiginitalea aurantiaca]MDM9632561.1 FAD/NAD(P)-binding protein [Robiginitalea aurantiaca]
MTIKLGSLVTQYNQESIQEITFIGAGIATAYSLLGLIEKLKQSNIKTPLKVTIIDKHPDFFKGIPYGDRSGNSVLLINALNRFMPEPHRGKFVAWLNQNRDALLDDFRKNGGAKTEKWVSDNLSSILENQWDTLYIPRYFYGKYISELLHNVISENEQRGVIKLSYVLDQADDITKSESIFTIITQVGINIQSKLVVLSVGSLPTKRVFEQTPVIKDHNFLLINDLYEDSLPSRFKMIRDFLAKRKGQDTNVLVLGANASSLETLYKFSDEEQLNQNVTNYTVLSSQGIMPDSEVDTEGQKRFIPEHLKALSDVKELTAEKIANAAYSDLSEARELGLGAASTVNVISKHVGILLPRLSFSESKVFACEYGNSIGRMQRCAGAHYTNTLKELSKTKRLRHIAGRFFALKPSEKGEAGLHLEYIARHSGKKSLDPMDFNIVVNCMGATDLKSNDTPLLLKNLISKNFITPNASGIGLEVDSEFQGSENLFIIGPLLAGNVIDNKPLWHLEHCGRIIWSSNLMASSLAQRIYTAIA